MLSKRYEPTEVDRRTWLHVPSGTPWSTSSDTHQVVEIRKETSTYLYNVMRIDKLPHHSSPFYKFEEAVFHKHWKIPSKMQKIRNDPLLYNKSEVDRRTWLHVPSGTPWSTSSDTHQVVDITLPLSIS